MRDRLLESHVNQCDETCAQVMKEPDREPTSQWWTWVQTGGPPNQPVILFDYSTRRAQKVPSRRLDASCAAGSRRDREHSIGFQLTVSSVGFMERLH
jgi:hypothetical protein